MAEVVVLRQFAYLDFEEDLDGIAEAAQAAAPDVEIVIERADPADPRTRGVTGQSIIEVIAPVASGYAFGKVADAIVAKARESWKARQKPNHWPRTHIVRILRPSGEVLREVKVSDDPPSPSSPRGAEQNSSGGLPLR